MYDSNAPTSAEVYAADRAFEREYYGSVYLSPANHALAEIVQALRIVHRLIDTWTEEHGRDCGCPFCSDDGNTDAYGIYTELCGVLWAIGVAEGTLSSVSVSPAMHLDAEAREAARDAEVQARIAEHCDRVDAERVEAAVKAALQVA